MILGIILLSSNSGGKGGGGRAPVINKQLCNTPYQNRVTTSDMIIRPAELGAMEKKWAWVGGGQIEIRKVRDHYLGS